MDRTPVKPLAIDLYCGLGGYDIEAHEYGEHRYPSKLILQDVLTLDGAQFKDATLIVGSSPCQEFSYRAMPWKRAKALGPPELGIALFQAQFRIQREASAAAGRQIPMVVENVRGAQPYVGRSRWNFGSYHLWGDVPALMPHTIRLPAKRSGHNWNDFKKTGVVSPHWRADGADSSAEKTSHILGRKQPGLGAKRDNGRGGGGTLWYQEGAASVNSKSAKRKFASAMIAKIPFDLSSHIARVYYRR